MSWDPLKDILSIHERVNRIFQDNSRSNESSQGEWAPPVDIYETESEVVILAELPGVSEDEIDIEIKDSVLSIRGTKSSPITAGTDNYYRLERNFGYFKRSFSLPSAIDTEDIGASIKDGILTITLKKDNYKKTKNIKVTKG